MEEFILEMMMNYAYLGMLLLLFACGFGFPVPEDIILFTAGYLCFKGIMHLTPSIALALFGVLVGDSIIFYIGKKFGNELRKGKAPRPFNKLFTPPRLRKMWHLFGLHGNKIVFIGRFFAGGRAPTFAVAGMSGMSYLTFICWDGLAALISVPLFIWLGKHFGEEIDLVTKYVAESKWVIFLVIIIVVGVIVWRRYFRNKKK